MELNRGQLKPCMERQSENAQTGSRAQRVQRDCRKGRYRKSYHEVDSLREVVK